MKLTKYDLETIGMIEGGKLTPEEIEQILKNQEYAEKYQVLEKHNRGVDDYLESLQIVERLKKRITWTRVMIIDEKNKERNVNFQWLLEHLISIENGEHLAEFQKMLGEEK